MDYYTNEASLKATYGDKEVSGLVTTAPGVEAQFRLDKAAKEAYDKINTYLRSGGYLTPLEFTPYTRENGGDLDGMVQSISDALTAAVLATSHDLSKKVYVDQRAEAISQLNAIRLGTLKLDLPKTDTPSGGGDLVVYTRPRVFKKSLKCVTEVVKGYPRAV